MNPSEDTGNTLFGFIQTLGNTAAQVLKTKAEIDAARAVPASGVSAGTGRPATDPLATSGQIIAGVSNQTLAIGAGVLLLAGVAFVALRK